MENDEIRQAVKNGYAKVAMGGSNCCAPEASCCGGPEDPTKAQSVLIGYDPDELDNLPDGANLGLGCGNPVGLAELEEGMTVVDLGSGAGIDCFLAAQRVGPTGHVIGVDMTPEMLEKARANATADGFENVEFRKGFIEELPVDDSSVDVIISNCVINLSPEKEKVFADAYRVLKPGGRLMVSDIVLLGELPEEVKNSIYDYVACVAGASMKDDYLRMIRDAGFESVEVVSEETFSGYPGVSSVKVRAIKDPDH
jgi:SAM-dependent methyltransferase